MRMSFGNTTAVLLVGSLLIPAASGQQAARYGTFSFVNVSAVSQPTIVSIDTAKLRPEGFKPGESTGKIGILAGQHQIEAIATGAQSAKETITVQEHASVTLIAYSIPHVDPATRQSTEALRLIVLPNPPKSAGKHFQLVYVSKRSEGEFIVNG